MNRDGTLLVDARGEAMTGAQPPFLLRFSPKLFGDEAPEMFHWDDSTNRLSLKKGRRKPWLRETIKQTAKTWCYCGQCNERYFCGGKRHVPYRDRASQNWVRPYDLGDMASAPSTQQETSTQPEPEAEQEPEEAPIELGDAPDEDPDDGDLSGQLPLAQEEETPELQEPLTLPTLAEYQKKWEARLEYHTRGNNAAFSETNLVPKPNSQLFQDCPWVPLLYQTSAHASFCTCVDVKNLLCDISLSIHAQQYKV